MGQSAKASGRPAFQGQDPHESFSWDGRKLRRFVTARDGRQLESPLPVPSNRKPRGQRVTRATAEQLLLRSGSPPPPEQVRGAVNVVDLFAGCGGLSLGISEACRALGLGFVPSLAVDSDESALAVYADNFVGANCDRRDINVVFDGQVGGRRTADERRLQRSVGSCDILAGGPPCQGHSDFNNRTRNNDSKNGLFLRMVRAAEVLEPAHVVIENVPGALRDRGSVVQRSCERLSDLGYHVDLGVVDLRALGVPQARRRLVVVASRDRMFDLRAMVGMHHATPTTVKWAIGDLVGVKPDSPFDTPAISAPQTRERIAYLFEHDLHELPDEQRPPCHSGGHSYTSIYGRLRWDRPAQTVTTGFYSMCMGRYVHPSRPRTITAHEAARLQFFPDYFRFSRATKRSELARLIGNAVPMKLAYAIGLELLR